MEQTKTHREQGKKWTLPIVLGFDLHHRFYDVVGYREPKKGEWFLSGAKVTAYKAPNNLGTKYLVAVPSKLAKQKTIWE